MNDEQRKLVEDNHNLIYAFLHKYNLSIDEYYDVAAIGLCKAAIMFDKKKECTFSTYAYLVMLTELKLVFRYNTSRKAIPLDKLTYYQSIISNGDGKEIERLSLIPDNVDVESEVMTNETFKQVYSILSEQDRRIIHMFKLGYKQKEIAKNVGCSQSYISKIKAKIIKLLKED